MRKLILPSIDFLSSVVDRELASAAASDGNGGFEAAELATAAASLGAAGKLWDNERIARAGRVLTAAITPDGFAIARPYHTGGTSYYQPSQPPILGAYAQILENVPSIELSEVALRRVVGYFAKTRREINTKRCSWRWAHGEKPQHSVYNTAISTLAIDRLCRMLDQRINDLALRHFTKRQPTALKLDRLFYPDYGIAGTERKNEAGKPRPSIAVVLERMRAHVASVKLESPYQPAFYSAVFHGPPGTGKTTLLEAVAASAGVPLVEVTPGDIVVNGTDAIEARARDVLRALSFLTRVVILFDEFDAVLETRGKKGKESDQPTIFKFLTGSMLPKLKTLYESAKKRHIAFAIATNFLKYVDPAAIRAGRFDTLVGVYRPDALSRIGRLQSEVAAFLRESKKPQPPQLNHRFVEMIRLTEKASMQDIGRIGWFTRPSAGKEPEEGTLFGYLFDASAGAKAPPVLLGEPWDTSDQNEPEKEDIKYIDMMENRIDRLTRDLF